MKKRLSGILFLLIASTAFTVDLGIILGGDGEYTEALNPEGFSVTATAVPWFSAVMSEKANLYISGKMTFKYDETQGVEPFLFEPERTELNLHPASVVYLTLGRQRFGDAAALIASGLFDGVDGSLNLGAFRLSLGAFYTGLLYKETANIIMTAGDLARYGKPLDSPNLEGYFASRRILLALRGQFPDLTPRTSLDLQGLAQFDLNDGPDTLNTQYLELCFAAELADPLHINLGGIGELAQSAGDLWWSTAAFAGLDWEVPGALTDLFSATFRWTGANVDTKLRAFMPLSGKNAGRIFNAGIAALMSAALSYQARPANSFSLDMGGAYFIRTDFVTLQDAALDGTSESRLLGAELYASLVWAPDAALRFSAGGGAFFPGWGGAFAKNTPVRWKANLGLLLSL